jgi:hypothetical protein
MRSWRYWSAPAKVAALGVGGLAAIAIVVALAAVVLTPSGGGQKVRVLPPVTLVTGAPTTSTTVRVRTTAVPVTSAKGRGAGGLVPGGQFQPSGTTVPPVTSPPVRHGLRLATASELAAIANDVPPPGGQQFDSAKISISDQTWGLLHAAPGGGHPQEYVVIQEINGAWKPVASGYPNVPCDSNASSDVRLDLAPVMTC